MTNRRIQVGKSTWNEFMSQGGWIQYNGSLKRLDLEHLLHESDMVFDSKKKGEEQRDDITSSSEQEEIEFITPTISVPFSVSGLENDKGLVDIKATIKENLLFVNKPSELLCVPGRGPNKDDCLVSRVLSRIQKEESNKNTKEERIIKPCHRLDYDTSGIVVFGLTSDGHKMVSQQFQDRQTIKTYIALVKGHPSKSSGIINLSIGKQMTYEGYNRWVIGGDKPRESITKWKVQEFFDIEGAKFSRVELTPKTGRGHQLRLHMAAIGHPILGDTLHAPRNVAKTSPRLCLHAHRLQFPYMGCNVAAEAITPF